jgi:hypothetical protein
VDKLTFAAYVIGVVAILQGAAWYLGYDGTVTTMVSGVILGICGSVFGMEYAKKKE